MADYDIKPVITNNEVKEILNKHYGLKEGSFTELAGYDDLNYHCKPRYSCNPFIKTLWNHGYVLKILNSLDSKNDKLVEAQNALMFHLRKHNITSTIPVQNMRGDYYFRKILPKNPSDREQKEHIIRLLEFQPGTVLRIIQISYSLLYKLGVYLAKLNEVLKEFSHPFYTVHSSPWHLVSVPKIKSMTQILENEKRKELVDNVIKKFMEDVLTKTETFEKGMIHGDFNEHNILISDTEEEEPEVSAILDFGDSHYSYYLFELAVALCYMMLTCKRKTIGGNTPHHPVIGAGHVLAGYLKIRPTFSPDFSLLKLCICARLCQSLVLGLIAFRHHPENTYVMDSQEMGWPLLEELWEISDEKITDVWRSVIQQYDDKDQ